MITTFYDTICITAYFDPFFLYLFRVIHSIGWRTQAFKRSSVIGGFSIWLPLYPYITNHPKLKMMWVESERPDPYIACPFLVRLVRKKSGMNMGEAVYSRERTWCTVGEVEKIYVWGFFFSSLLFVWQGGFELGILSDGGICV